VSSETKEAVPCTVYLSDIKSNTVMCAVFNV